MSTCVTFHATPQCLVQTIPKRVPSRNSDKEKGRFFMKDSLKTVFLDDKHL